ncbi:hypothetical protein [Microbacterium sp. 77mftsu3.1]|uniref:hypothetical protein n=1 Tax=Microbacterium sp. 77mftsu3.1 TaxID=1761802 RepID=UPI00035E2B02|nr:hypothetical protein [Microbacterium sp. 77mftsu3.1]SDH34100.1 hypothetical protein SAMN04488590_3074 [Microbacterium sp. 77mftsu3.1]
MTDSTAFSTIIRTAAGTELLLEQQDGRLFLTRKPGMAKPTGGYREERLPGDFEPLPLGKAPTVPNVGLPAKFHVIVGGETVKRITTPVTEVVAS